MNTYPNSTEHKHWNTTMGEKWVAFQQHLDQLISAVSDELFCRAALTEGTRVMDVGCGAGTTTAEIAARVGTNGHVLGIDISQPLMTVARQRLAGIANCTLKLADAQTHEFNPDTVDVIFSRFGVMFFEHPVTAFKNLAHALKPGGHIYFACWAAADMNPWFTVPRDIAIARLGAPDPRDPRTPGPTAFAEAAYVNSILEQANFSDIHVDRQTLILHCDDVSTAAMLASNLGPAVRIYMDKGGTSEDMDYIRSTVQASFEQFVGDTRVEIPAEINFCSATLN